MKEGKPQFAYNFLGNVTTIAAPEALPAGRVSVKYDFAYDGGKPGAGGTGTIYINGKKAASGRIEHTIPFLFGLETADVGVDLYTPVTAAYRKGDNKFTGEIRKVTVDLKYERDDRPIPQWLLDQRGSERGHRTVARSATSTAAIPRPGAFGVRSGHPLTDTWEKHHLLSGTWWKEKGTGWKKGRY